MYVFSEPEDSAIPKFDFLSRFKSLQKRGSTGPESVSEEYTFFREDLPSSSLDKLLGLDHFRQYEIWDIFKVLPTVKDCEELIASYFSYWVSTAKQTYQK
jgi:hypothetical protein